MKPGTIRVRLMGSYSPYEEGPDTLLIECLLCTDNNVLFKESRVFHTEIEGDFERAELRNWTVIVRELKRIALKEVLSNYSILTTNYYP